MKKTILIFIGLTLLVCCNSKNKQDQSSQIEKVIAIHDEVMPKMGRLAELVGELKPKVDSTEVGQEYNDAMKDLQDAHESMMGWMQGFGERFDSDEILNGKELTPQKKIWLNEEEEKVKALREQINASIENAETLLNKK